MTLYEELASRKENGELLRIGSLSKDELEQLWFHEEKSDNEIAELFSIKSTQVKYRRRKLGVTLKNYLINKVLAEKPANEEAFRWLKEQSNLDLIAKGLTHFIFRNGPVEAMHCAGKLGQNDMKILNKYVLNHLAYVIGLIQGGNWLELGLLIDLHKHFGLDWEPPEPIDNDVISLLSLVSSL